LVVTLVKQATKNSWQSSTRSRRLTSDDVSHESRPGGPVQRRCNAGMPLEDADAPSERFIGWPVRMGITTVVAGEI